MGSSEDTPCFLPCLSLTERPLPAIFRGNESFASILGRFPSTFLNALNSPHVVPAFRFWGRRQSLVQRIPGSQILKGHRPFIRASFHLFPVLIDFFGHIRKHSRQSLLLPLK